MSGAEAAGPRRVSFLMRWHGVWRQRGGPGGLYRSVLQLQGCALAVSDLETAVLPARIRDYSTLDLDRLIGAGKLLWQGAQPLGRHDGEIGLYAADAFPLLGRIGVFAPGQREAGLRELLLARGGLDFEGMVAALGGFPDDMLRSLWRLVWHGEVTSDSLNALRARLNPARPRYHPRARPRYSRRRRVLPGTAGRWRLLTGPRTGFAPESERGLAAMRQMLDRNGLIDRGALDTMQLPDADLLLQRLVDEGRAEPLDLCRGGGCYAAPGAAEVWDTAARPASGILAACDPANPFGRLAAWPAMCGDYRPWRTPGARVLVADGRLVGYLTRSGRELHTPATMDDPEPLLRMLGMFPDNRPVFIESVDGQPPYGMRWHPEFVAAGFSPSRRGYLLRRA